MSDCIFCKIASGETKSDIVYQDDKVVAFNDIAPQAPTHILVIPRAHAEKLSSLSSKDTADQAASLFKVIKKIVAEKGLDQKGYRVVLNQGAAAGQAVPHIHFHLLSGRAFSWPPG